MPKHFYKKWLKIWLLAAFGVLFLVSCAIVPKPKTADPATITINIAGALYDTKTDSAIIKSALTYWRKLGEDGSRGDRFAIGGANAFNRAMNTSRFRKVRDETLRLDAGVYYLDSFEIEAPKNIAISQAGDYTKRDGWDSERGEAMLSISIKEGEIIAFPRLIFSIIQKGEPKSYTHQFEILVCGEVPENMHFGSMITHSNASQEVCDEVFGGLDNSGR